MHANAYHVFVYLPEVDMWDEMTINWSEKQSVAVQLAWLVDLLEQMDFIVEYTAW